MDCRGRRSLPRNDTKSKVQVDAYGTALRAVRGTVLDAIQRADASERRPYRSRLLTFLSRRSSFPLAAVEQCPASTPTAKTQK